MLIIGAKGFAKEVLQSLPLQNHDEVAFYDDVNCYTSDLVFNKFQIIKTLDAAKLFFERNSPFFTLGIGNPYLRYEMFHKFKLLGGQIKGTISTKAVIGPNDVSIGEGSNVLANAIFSNSTSIGRGCIVYYNVIITHDTEVDEFVELSPGATLLGRCKIGKFSQVGANATILPDRKIGANVIIGAGAVVTHDVPDNVIVTGVPARIVKDNHHFGVGL